MIVKATREGLVGRQTATGWTIDASFPFVALPSHAALRRWVKLAANGRTCCALVLDVGPWNENDDAYVFHGARPAAEAQPHSNGAGIDLGEYVWRALGMADNGLVTWEFV